MKKITLAVALLASVLSLPAMAANFRWANDGDVNSMDPYTRQETFQLSFMANIYEPLVRRGRDMSLEPALATRWEQTAPTVWRFNLRPNVKFQGGEPFSADDVLFSIQRARAQGSNVVEYVSSIKEVRRIDDLTVEIETNAPNPILPAQLFGLSIMSKVWCEANNATAPADLTASTENFATRHANGTGPFILGIREPDRRTTLRRNPDWWDKPEHNLDTVEFNVVANSATRVAALLSGEIDMMYTVPPQDMERIGRTQGAKLMEMPELRTVFLGFDQMRPELLKSDVQGRNPFQDERVRRAFWQAIDTQAIHQRVMRRQSRPTALMIGPGVNGFDASIDQRPPVDVEAAKKLLAEAGYPNGFSLTMDCPNDRYVNDEAICQAVVAMLARINIRINLVAQTRVRYFAEINPPRYNTSFYMLGWTPVAGDAISALFSLAGTRDGTRGVFNNGGFSVPELDQMISQIAVESDQAKRQTLINQALTLIRDRALYIPLHQQQLVWAMRSNVQVAQMPDNYFPLRYVRVGE